MSNGLELNQAQIIFDICKVLNKNKVEFIIVGGTAVAFYGFARPSSIEYGKLLEKYDLDFWYNPTHENYYKMLNSITELGKDVTRYKEEVAPVPNKGFFKFDFENCKADFLPEIKGLDNFYSAYSRSEKFKIQEIEISVISLDDLITSKEAILRPKDIEDIKQLKLINKRKPNQNPFS